jgi:hypothetical protein
MAKVTLKNPFPPSKRKKDVPTHTEVAEQMFATFLTSYTDTDLTKFDWRLVAIEASRRLKDAGLESVIILGTEAAGRYDQICLQIVRDIQCNRLNIARLYAPLFRYLNSRTPIRFPREERELIETAFRRLDDATPLAELMPGIRTESAQKELQEIMSFRQKLANTESELVRLNAASVHIKKRKDWREAVTETEVMQKIAHIIEPVLSVREGRLNGIILNPNLAME